MALLLAPAWASLLRMRVPRVQVIMMVPDTMVPASVNQLGDKVTLVGSMPAERQAAQYLGVYTKSMLLRRSAMKSKHGERHGHYEQSSDPNKMIWWDGDMWLVGDKSNGGKRVGVIGMEDQAASPDLASSMAAAVAGEGLYIFLLGERTMGDPARGSMSSRRRSTVELRQQNLENNIDVTRVTPRQPVVQPVVAVQAPKPKPKPAAAAIAPPGSARHAREAREAREAPPAVAPRPVAPTVAAPAAVPAAAPPSSAAVAVEAAAEWGREERDYASPELRSSRANAQRASPSRSLALPTLALSRVSPYEPQPQPQP